MPFLPIKRSELSRYNTNTADFIIVTGDAYVDHPSFGTAIISRVLENAGYVVGIISQPAKDKDFLEFGVPKYAFLVNSGNIDSMVAHYTAAKKRRSDDAYTPGGKSGKRPDRAVTVYCKKLRELFGDVQIAIGGLEASLRRFAHYDYWDNCVKPSILIESTADLLMYGMGEKHILEIAEHLKNGYKLNEITDVRSICYLTDIKTFDFKGCAECPSFEAVKENNETSKREYAVATKIQQQQQDAFSGKTVVQKHGKMLLVQRPPVLPLTQAELDAVYDLPYMRDYHPVYEQLGGVPGIKEVKFSIIHNRGCFGACNFCALAYHQGRYIVSRSHNSVIKEAEKITRMPDFKGYIHDVGGPTANFRFPSCPKQEKFGLCKDKKCLAPEMCKAVKVDHTDYLELLRKLRALPKVKKVFIRSGIRFDYLIADKNEAFFKELVTHHISGQLKVAPEHCSDNVLNYMGKPNFSVYKKFYKRFYELTQSAGKKQFLVPYLMSSHPGSTINDAIELALFLKKEGLHPEQVQDFYPTPGTISTCMFYTGINPLTMLPVYVPKTPAEKAEQRALLQYYLPENKAVVTKALIKAGRKDLIGNGRNCLVTPVGNTNIKNNAKPKKTIRNIHKPKKH